MKKLSYDEFREGLFKIIADINAYPGGSSTYLEQGLPCDLDQIITEAIRTYIIEEPEQVRRMWACQIFGSAHYYFGVFATRAAMISVRKGDHDLILAAMIATSIEGRGIDDYRYNLITLSLVYRSAILLEINLPETFKRAGDLADAEGYFEHFLHRSEHDKSIEAMGQRAGESPAGLVYWPDPEQAPVNWRTKPDLKNDL